VTRPLRVHLPDPEYLHLEAFGFDGTKPGYILRLPLADGRGLIVHMPGSVHDQLRIVGAPCPEPCCARLVQAEAAA